MRRPNSCMPICPCTRLLRAISKYITCSTVLPCFGIRILGALQTAGFIALGRIFDQNSKYNIDRLLRLAQNNPSIFSKAALAARKQGQSATPPDWLDDYMKTVHVPTPAYFRRIRSFVRKNRKVYEARYRDIRRKWFAHREIPDATEASGLFANTNIRELELLVTFLASLHDALWQLSTTAASRYSAGNDTRLAPCISALPPWSEIKTSTSGSHMR